eukprot:7201733-Prymnesium_polylepis.1
MMFPLSSATHADVMWCESLWPCTVAPTDSVAIMPDTLSTGTCDGGLVSKPLAKYLRSAARWHTYARQQAP